MFPKREYRITTDPYAGYEVQIRRWWHYPFWFCLDQRTFASVEKAERYAKAHARQVVKLVETSFN